jgi:hypothetical protein
MRANCFASQLIAKRWEAKLLNLLVFYLFKYLWYFDFDFIAFCDFLA